MEAQRGEGTGPAPSSPTAPAASWKSGVSPHPPGPYLANNIVAAKLVLVHDSDDDGRLPQLLRGDIKGKRLVEDGVQVPLHSHCLLLLHPLVFVHQPHLHIGVWGMGRRVSVGAPQDSLPFPGMAAGAGGAVLSPEGG